MSCQEVYEGLTLDGLLCYKSYIILRQQYGPISQPRVQRTWLCHKNPKRIDSGNDMNGLPDQVISHLLDGEDKSKALFLDWVVTTIRPNKGSAEIIDGLSGTFIILLCEQST